MGKVSKQEEVLMPPLPPTHAEDADIKLNTSSKQSNNKRQSIIINPFAQMISADKKPGFISPNTNKKQFLLQEEAKRMSGLGLEKAEAIRQKLRRSSGADGEYVNDGAMSNSNNENNDNDVDDLDALVSSTALTSSVKSRVGNIGQMRGTGLSQVRRSGGDETLRSSSNRRASKEGGSSIMEDVDTTTANANAAVESNPFGALL